MLRDSESSWTGFAGFALVAAVIGSIFLLDGPLETLRPEQQSETMAAVAADEVVLTRLWQDPLHAIQTHWNDIVLNRPDGEISRLRTGFPPHITEMPGSLTSERSGPNLQLVVMMRGEPYAEDRENRRRQRHAVVSALTESDYVPKDAARLGYFTAPCFEGSCRGQSQETGHREQTMLVGFESYERALELESEGESAPQWDSIVVLWLNSEDFRSCALQRVSALAEYLEGSGGRGVPATTVLVGPPTSGALSKLRAIDVEDECSDVVEWWRTLQSNQAAAPGADRSESSRNAPGDKRREFAGTARLKSRYASLRILSTRATAPLDLLFPEEIQASCSFESRTIPEASSADSCLERYLGVAAFHSVVARDDVVLSAILGELRARGASRALIAIVSEQDSAYGRLLDDVVEDLVERRAKASGSKNSDRFRVAEYGYLAGVDGEMPPNAAQTDPRPGASVEGAPGVADRSPFIRRSHQEAAFGAAQLDYVRRLADHIAENLRNPRSDANESKDAKERGQAIVVGVLGSDVYDKLLILEALRNRLPAATFFTTDLDARLSHPDVYRWTRNLIVGSAYGLTVKDLKGAAFRDSYQTATYRAVRLALELVESDALPSRGTAPHPRLFEVGRTGPVDITDRRGEAVQRDYDQVHGTVPYIRPSSSAFRRAGEGLLVLAPLLILVVVSFTSKRVLHRKTADLRRKARGRVAAWGGVFAIGLGLLMWALREDHEPWPLTEGVNSLPTLVLYLTTVFYAWSIVVIAKARVAQAEEAFHSEWNLPARRGSSDWRTGALLRKGPGSWLRDGPWIWRWRQTVPRYSTPETRSAEESWERYLEYSAPSARRLRLVLPVGLSVVLVPTVVYGLSLPAPLLSRNLDEALRAAGVLTILGVLFAVFFCSDVLRLGHAMLRDLARHEVVGWPIEEGDRDDHISQHWRTMRFLEAYTDSIMPVATLPFVLLALLMVARSTLFEGWVWTGQILTLYVGFVLYIVVWSLRFQFEAVRAKDAVLACLDRHRLAVIDKAEERERLAIVQERIKGVHRGAFGPWTHHPIVQSLLFSFVAYGMVFLLEAAL